MDRSNAPNGVYGSTVAIVMMANTLINNGRLGRLLSGFAAVRITNTTSVSGPITRTSYRFRGPGARLQVDHRDAPYLRVVPNFRQIR